MPRGKRNVQTEKPVPAAENKENLSSADGLKSPGTTPAKENTALAAAPETAVAISAPEKPVSTPEITATAVEKAAPAPASAPEQSAEKTPAKRGRKPKAETAPTVENAPAKRGRKPATKNTAASSKTSANAENAVPAEKTKRTYNKKKNNNKAEKIIVQSGAAEYTMADIIQKCKDDYRNGTKKQVRSIDVYLKAEDGTIRAYYVVNGQINKSIDL